MFSLKVILTYILSFMELLSPSRTASHHWLLHASTAARIYDLRLSDDQYVTSTSLPPGFGRSTTAITAVQLTPAYSKQLLRRIRFSNTLLTENMVSVLLPKTQLNLRHRCSQEGLKNQWEFGDKSYPNWFQVFLFFHQLIRTGLSFQQEYFG